MKPLHGFLALSYARARAAELSFAADRIHPDVRYDSHRLPPRIPARWSVREPLARARYCLRAARV